MDKIKTQVFTLHHARDDIHHCPAMFHIHNTAKTDSVYTP